MNINRRNFVTTASIVPLAACGGSGSSGALISSAQAATPSSSDLLSLISATPDGSALILQPGSVYQLNSLDLTNKAITIVSYGVTFNCIGAGFIKSDHGKKLSIFGGNFVGTGSAINLNMVPTVNTYDDYQFNDLTFNVNSDYAIRLIGCREGRINDCTFTGSGLYLQAAVSPFVEKGIFIGQRVPGRAAVFYDGTGSPYDAGLVLSNCEAMGWDRGVDIRYTDWFRMSGCTVDFNTSCNTQLVSQDGASIEGCYLGSENTIPALYITAGPFASVPAYSDKIRVSADFTGHFEGQGYDCIKIDGAPDRILFNGCNIEFYTRFGINYALAGANMTICGGTAFAPRFGYGQFPISNSIVGGDAGLVIDDSVIFPTGTKMSGSGVMYARIGKVRGLV